MTSIFTRIVNGEISCHKVAENDQFLAFLDIMPLTKGHTLVIPKQEIDYFFDLEDKLLSSMVLFAKEVAVSIQNNFSCKKVGMTVIGLEVPHAHIHLVPINQVGDMDFSRPKLQLTHDELALIAQKLRID